MENIYSIQNTMQEEYGGGKKYNELKLINSGAFGCIYNPSMTCKGNVGSIKYLTKIQKSKRAIANELQISEKVKNINGYARFFAPVLKSCLVRIAKDHIEDIKKCEVFKDESTKTIKSSSYVSMKTRYVGKQDLKKYVHSNMEPNTFLNELLRSHTYLLKAIQKLFNNKIIHYDLKYNNIIYDSERKVPIIIDFGQSFSIDNLNTNEQLSTAFFILDQYNYWCIDILICSYIFQEVGYEKSKTTLVTKEEIEIIYDIFMYGKKYKNNDKQIINNVYLYNILQNPQKLKQFKNVFDEYTTAFINKRTWWELYEDLLKCANTWDNYSLAIIYLNFLDDVFLLNPELYNKMLNTDMRLKTYVELLEQVVYNNPYERISVSSLISKLELIIKQK